MVEHVDRQMPVPEEYCRQSEKYRACEPEFNQIHGTGDRAIENAAPYDIDHRQQHDGGKRYRTKPAEKPRADGLESTVVALRHFQKLIELLACCSESVRIVS